MNLHPDAVILGLIACLRDLAQISFEPCENLITAVVLILSAVEFSQEGEDCQVTHYLASVCLARLVTEVIPNGQTAVTPYG